MESHMDHQDHKILLCDGSIDTNRKGSPQGHFGPGAIFIVWGSWWIIASMLRFIHSLSPQSHLRQFQSSAWYPMFSPQRHHTLLLHILHYLEPILKIIGPALMVSLELFLDHSEFRSLYCPAGTSFQGRFDVSHLNNWQHAASYPAFFLAGVIDVCEIALTSFRERNGEAFIPQTTRRNHSGVRSTDKFGVTTTTMSPNVGIPPTPSSSNILLPPRAGQAAMALAFSTMAFLMGTHQKHEPLDAMMHWCLFFAMCLVSILSFVELNAPNNPTVSISRGAATVLLGAWFCVIGHAMFDDEGKLPQWSASYHGGVMLTPVLFSFLTVVVVFCTVVLIMATILLQGKFGVVDKLVGDWGIAASTSTDSTDSSNSIQKRGTDGMQYNLIDPSKNGPVFIEDDDAFRMDMDGTTTTKTMGTQNHQKTHWHHHPSPQSHVYDEDTYNVFAEDSAQVSDSEQQPCSSGSSSSGATTGHHQNHHHNLQYAGGDEFELARLERI